MIKINYDNELKRFLILYQYYTEEKNSKLFACIT